MKRIVLLISMLVMTQVFSQQVIKDLTVNKFTVVNTKLGAKPCPLMSESQRNAIAIPENGDCIYNTTTLKLNTYDGALWKAAGGGGIDAWETAFAYKTGNLIVQSAKIYSAVSDHTSGTFATDLADSKWTEVSQGVTDHTQLTNIGTNTHSQIDSHIANNANPHAVTKAQVGLSAVSNIDTTTTANITDSTDKRFVTDANLTTIGNQSGVNTGDLASKSQLDVSPVTTNELQTPLSQLTTTAPGKRRIETGNTNELRNPSFEGSPYNSGWTCPTGTISQAVGPDGSKALQIVSTGAGFECNQTFTSTADLKGSLASFFAKIKTAAPNVKMCGLDGGSAPANRVNCVNVSQTNANIVYATPSGFFNYGSMVYGITIFTDDAAAFPTVIDDVSMGIYKGGGLSTFSNNTGWIPCTFSTLAWQGFGSVANNLECRRDGPNLKMRGSFTVGTTAPSLGQIPLPTNWGTILPSASISSGSSYGTFYRSAVAVSTIINAVATSGTGVIGVSNALSSGANNPSVAVNGNAAFSTGEVGVINNELTIPIAGWEANTNAAIAGCVDAFGCTNELSLKSSAAGVVSGENVDWVNGNAVVTDTSLYTFNIVGFTSAPICQITATDVSAFLYGGQFQSISNTQVVVRMSSDSAAKAANPFFLNCQKTGTDFKPKTVVVSPLQGYVKVPGAENLNVDTFSVSYGKTINTVCDGTGLVNTNQCAYLDQIGTAVSSITRSSAGTYVLNTAKTYSKIKCNQSMITAGTISVAQVPASCSNCSSINFGTYNSSFVASDSYGHLICQGTF